jgi:hypothetical protein
LIARLPSRRTDAPWFSCCRPAAATSKARLRAALEEHFWLPAGADPARTLKAFEDGRNRIVAVAQRKLLARPDEPLWLTVNDFLIR